MKIIFLKLEFDPPLVFSLLSLSFVLPTSLPSCLRAIKTPKSIGNKSYKASQDFCCPSVFSMFYANGPALPITHAHIPVLFQATCFAILAWGFSPSPGFSCFLLLSLTQFSHFIGMKYVVFTVRVTKSYSFTSVKLRQEIGKACLNRLGCAILGCYTLLGSRSISCILKPF